MDVCVRLVRVPAQGGAPAAAAAQPAKKKKEVKEIPVPPVREVPEYTREYLPRFRIPDTYIRGKGERVT
jgi:enhancer of polycomb-like protein